jgi:hypothetical protein
MKTYKDLLNLITSINAILDVQEEKVQQKFFKLYAKIKHHHDAYNDALDELRLDNAATDEKGLLIKDDKGGYEFTKDGLKALKKDIEALNNKEIDFTPIEVINPNGFEKFVFLKGWVNGVNFVEDDSEL